MIQAQQEEAMAKTFIQMADEAMAQARMVSAEEALKRLERDSNALLVDVRDESEVGITGLGVRALNAPGRSLAWKADQEIDIQYREAELQDRNRQIITTCGLSPCYRGAKAANLLTTMGFSNVCYVDGGMQALLAAGIPTR
jgi:rhodanese-related sulfurtransferase